MINKILSYKRILIYFFSFFFLASKIGLSLNFHYCGDEIYLISFSSNPKGCDMKSNGFKNHKNSLEINTQDCCKNDIVFLQNDKPEYFKIANNKTENHNNFFFIKFTIPNYSYSFYNNFDCKPPPRINKNLYLFYNQFILYG